MGNLFPAGMSFLKAILFLNVFEFYMSLLNSH